MNSRIVRQVAGGVLCTACRRVVQAEYKAQDPAPCGCAWVWEDNRLVAVPSREPSGSLLDGLELYAAYRNG